MISAFGVEHSEISKAKKQQRPATPGHYVVQEDESGNKLFSGPHKSRAHAAYAADRTNPLHDKIKAIYVQSFRSQRKKVSKSAKKLGLKLAQVASGSREPHALNYLATRLSNGKHAAGEIIGDRGTGPTHARLGRSGKEWMGSTELRARRQDLAQATKERTGRYSVYDSQNKSIPERGNPVKKGPIYNTEKYDRL